MKRLLPVLGVCLVASGTEAFELEDYIDRLDNALAYSAFEDNFRARISGTIDLELYHFQQPSPGLIDSEIDTLFNPRLTLFLDAQAGKQFYFFVQTRID